MKQLARMTRNEQCGQDPSPCLTLEPNPVSAFSGWQGCGQTQDIGPGVRHASPLRSAEHLEANTCLFPWEEGSLKWVLLIQVSGLSYSTSPKRVSR